MDLFVARQPVFDRAMAIIGYELLFRSGPFNRYGADDHDRASASTIANSFFEIGIDRLVGDGQAFVNFTRNTLLDGYATVLPRERLVVEVLEDVVVDREVRISCELLKSAGYTLALDDFAPGVASEGLLDLADIIKVDFTQVNGATRAKLSRSRPNRRVKMLAEKMETQEDVVEARDLGYDLFQGYVLSRPELQPRRRSSSVDGHRLVLMRVLQGADPDLREIEDLLLRDPGLSFKLLRYVNSAALGLRSPARTIRAALTFLGQAGVRVWGMIAIVADLGAEQPPELVTLSVVRGKFCELIGRGLGLEDRASDLFLLGLFSLIDTITGRSIEDVMAELPLADDVRDALLGGATELGAILRLTIAYERGCWDAVAAFAAHLGIIGDDLPPMYLSAVDWGNLSRYLA